MLDAPERPELYVYNDPYPNAITLGVDKPFIAISSSLYDLCDDDERRFVLGHELGHAMSGHALYQSLLQHLLNLIGSFGWIPAGGLGLRALIAALREWQRKAELSGDRAGLLATQDVDAGLRLQMKMAARRAPRPDRQRRVPAAGRRLRVHAATCATACSSCSTPRRRRTRSRSCGPPSCGAGP